MKRAVRAIWVGGLMALAGCAGGFGGRMECAHQGCVPCESATSAAVTLTPTVRGTIQVRKDHLPGTIGDVEAALRTLPTAAYYSLTVSQCQCLAARASTLGNLLEQESALLHAREEAQGRHPLCPGDSNPRRRNLTHAILIYSSLEARNRSAAEALEMYYRLAEAEAQADLLEESLAIASDTIAKSESLRKQGLATPVDLEVLRRQRLELLRDQVQARLAVDQLNSELQAKLELSLKRPNPRLWPAEGFEIKADEPAPDVDAALARGLMSRPDLLVLRLLRWELDGETLPAARRLLATLSPLLGDYDKGGRQAGCVQLMCQALACGGADADQAEAAERRRQILELLNERELAAANEIRRAVWTEQAQRRILILAAEKESSVRTKAQELEKKAAQGTASFAETAAAKLELLKAQAELVHSLAAHRIARVKLSQAQGELATACGFTPDHPCGIQP